MLILHYADPKFLAGLPGHRFPAEHGLRLVSTGYATTPFGERWRDSPGLAAARESGKPYLLDRLIGGMPFQSLDGLTEIAQTLKDDPNFLGFQVHEWDNSPLHDQRHIRESFLEKGIAFNEDNFAQYLRRTTPPYFSAGNYATYRDLYAPLNSMDDVRRYLEAYFSHMVDLTRGQVMSVNGYGQFPHAAFRLGGKNVMAEIGSQVPQSAMQIACVRGAAHEINKPFGVYYETWGGAPFSCTCATSFSPWLPDDEQFRSFEEFGGARPQGGSSRALQRRLLYFAWLSGARWWADEWGAENYFADWDQHPLTEYGRIVRDFTRLAQRIGPVTPIVPAALVLPPESLGLDVAYVGGHRRRVLDVVEPDACHARLKVWATTMLAPQPWQQGGEAHSLTPSHWAGALDVLSADASPAVLSRYKALMYVDDNQRGRADHPAALGIDLESALACQAIMQQHLPMTIEGEVGCIQARSADRLLVGLFNNLGVTKIDGEERFDPHFARTATLTGPCADPDALYGEPFIRDQMHDTVTVNLPPGDLAILSFALPS